MNIPQYYPDNAGFRIAISHFQQKAERYGLSSDLQAYRAQGKEREARNYQVLVHPNYAFDRAWTEANVRKGFPKSILVEWNLRYFKKMIELVLESPETTIIIHDDLETGLDITQLHSKIILSSGGNGVLMPDEFRKFFELTEGVHPDDTFDVHGSIWGRCPDAFSMQLYIASKFGGYSSRVASLTDDLLTDQMISYILDLKELPVRNIQTGVQHNTALLVKPRTRSTRFMGENSVIIPSPEEVSAVGGE